MSAEIELKELEKDKLIDIILHNEKEIEKLKKKRRNLKKNSRNIKMPILPLPNCAFDKPQAKGLPVGRRKAKK